MSRAQGWDRTFESLEPLHDCFCALEPHVEIAVSVHSDSDATDKHSCLKKTFLKQLYYQFSHCCGEADVDIS